MSERVDPVEEEDLVPAESGGERLRAVVASHRFRHSVAIAFIVLAACLLFYQNFYTSGTLIHVDMTYPTSIGRNMSLYANTWWQYGSVQNVWNVQRVFWSYPLLAVAWLVHMPTWLYLLIMFVGTFALAGVSMYALAFHFLRSSRFTGLKGWAPHIGGVFAALVYMFNPWSVSHLWPYFGYPAYAVLPLVFLLLVKAVDQPRARYLVPLALLISVASTGPICVVWFWMLIVTYLVFNVIWKKFGRDSLKAALKVLAVTAALYFVLNAMWIFPYLGAVFLGKPMVPGYTPQLSQSMMDVLSANNTLLNNVRLVSGWGMPVPLTVNAVWWEVLGFAIPVLALVGVLAMWRKVRRSRYVLYWGAMFIIAVLLATGTSWILRRPYSYMVLQAPGAGALGWVLRVPDRWLVFVPLFYAMMLAVLVAALLQKGSRTRMVVAAVAAAAVLVSLVPVTLNYARNVYNPTAIPSEYAAVDRYVNARSPGARSVRMPFERTGFRYFWAPEKRIGAFDVYSSNPSLNNLTNFLDPNSYFYWLEDLLSSAPKGRVQLGDKQAMLGNDVIGKLLAPFSTQYLVFDKSVPEYRFGDSLDRDESIKRLLMKPYLDLYRVKNPTSHIRAVSSTVVAGSFYDNLALSQAVPAERLTRVAFVDDVQAVVTGAGYERLSDHSVTVNANAGFDQWGPDGQPVGWQSSEGPQVVTLERGWWPGLEGDSLKVVHRSYQPTGIAWLWGSEVPARAGEVYTFGSRFKYQNSDWTYCLVQGYRLSEGAWVDLLQCPTIQSGNFGSGYWRGALRVPEGVTALRPVLAAGQIRDPEAGASISWFDDVRLEKVDGGYIDSLGAAPVPTITTRQESPQKFVVDVKGAGAPFMLAFGESYDPLWTARIAGQQGQDPVKLYSTINGFPVNKRGDFTITLEYRPQSWFLQGLVVSLVTVLLCLAYLYYAYIRRRAVSQAISSSAGAAVTTADAEKERQQ